MKPVVCSPAWKDRQPLLFCDCLGGWNTLIFEGYIVIKVLKRDLTGMVVGENFGIL